MKYLYINLLCTDLILNKEVLRTVFYMKTVNLKKTSIHKLWKIYATNYPHFGNQCSFSYVDHIEKAYEYASAKLLDLLMTDKKLLYRLR